MTHRAPGPDDVCDIRLFLQLLPQHHDCAVKFAESHVPIVRFLCPFSQGSTKCQNSPCLIVSAICDLESKGYEIPARVSQELVLSQ